MLRLVLLLGLLLGVAQATVTVTPGFIEGPNVPDGPFLATVNHNCQPQLGAEFTRAWAFVLAPNVAGGQGFIGVTACQYREGDALPGLPPGTYQVAGSICPADIAAVVTRWQTSLVPYSGGGDGGCDEPGPLSLDVPLAAHAQRTSIQLRGHITVRKSGRWVWHVHTKVPQ